MLYELEWLTPHDFPNGMTVPEWVDEVRELEARGWLRDPNSVEWPKDKSHPANLDRAARDQLCPRLCWRRRCLRAQRCRHMIPLAQREFMPELSVHLSALLGETSPYSGPLNADKMELLAELLPPDCIDRPKQQP